MSLRRGAPDCCVNEKLQPRLWENGGGPESGHEWLKLALPTKKKNQKLALLATSQTGLVRGDAPGLSHSPLASYSSGMRWSPVPRCSVSNARDGASVLLHGPNEPLFLVCMKTSGSAGVSTRNRQKEHQVDKREKASKNFALVVYCCNK